MSCLRNIATRTLRWMKQANPEPAISQVLIAVIGCTGAGISTLIHAATGSYADGVARADLTTPYTQNIKPIPVKIPGVTPTEFPVTLVDTPGIDFANGPDLKTTFRGLNNWKIKHYGDKATFSAIIFVYRPSTRSLEGQMLHFQHDAILKKLCGVHWKEKMVLVHNYCDGIRRDAAAVSPEGLIAVEQELKEGFWRQVAAADIRTKRDPLQKIQRFDFNDQRKSAWKILWSLLKDTSINVSENKLATFVRDQSASHNDPLQGLHKANERST